MSERLTVTKDWPRLQQWADEIVLARECEAAAYMDWIEAEATSKAAIEKARIAKQLWHDTKTDTAAAETVFHTVLDEMTRPASYDEVPAHD